eukprot:TRINITY_DN9490_c0_g1_i1.p1 TRINITY_DN9490_c0_g1~~TRINITY_DN9490_c0_g1_i1.p1  ORF type:complete len:1084 (+),score=329.34 TRINITY_DN9490_c0_g1_i1:60-3254(+)
MTEPDMRSSSNGKRRGGRPRQPSASANVQAPAPGATTGPPSTAVAWQQLQQQEQQLQQQQQLLLQQLQQQLHTLQMLQSSGAPHLEAAIAEIQARIDASVPQPAPTAAPIPSTRPDAAPADDAQQPAASAVSTQRPCSHNTWDNVRTKKGQVFLRCRECDAQWRTAVEGLSRCSAFISSAGCAAGASCGFLHLHARKQSLGERVAKHGAAVLDRVPASTHPDGRAPDERKPADTTAAADQNPLLLSPPCAHNSWDNVRMKKGQVFMRCRECEAQWRLPGDRIDRCVDFISPGGCKLGPACPLLHLHPRKQSLHERVAKHGSGLLERNAGVSVLTVSKQHGPSIGATVKGSVVTRVAAGGPAEMGGLRAGMTVVAVNGNGVGAATTDVVTAVRAAWADNHTITISVTEPARDGDDAETPTNDPYGVSPSAAPPHDLLYGVSPGTAPPPLEDAVSSCASCASLASATQDVTVVVHRHGAEALGMTVRGATITKVVPGSPAAVAGVAEEMRLVAVNGVAVGSTTKSVVGAVRDAWERSELCLRLRASCHSCRVPDDDDSSAPSLPGSPSARADQDDPHLTRSSYGDTTAGSLPALAGSVPTDTALDDGSERARVDDGELLQLVVVKRGAADSFGASVKANRVTRVHAGSAAAVAGVTEGMRVVSVNGRQLRPTTVDVVTAIRAAWKQAPTLEVSVCVRTVPRYYACGQSESTDFDGCSTANLSAVSELSGAGSLNLSRCSSPQIAAVSPSFGYDASSPPPFSATSPNPSDPCWTLNTPPTQSSMLAMPCFGSTPPGATAAVGCSSFSGEVAPPDIHAPLHFTVYAAGHPLPWAQCPIASGGPVWVDRSYGLSQLPPCLANAAVLRGPYKSVARGTPHTVYCAEDLDLYLIHAVALGRNGGFPQSLPVGPRPWARMEGAPRWVGGAVSKLGMTMWGLRACAGESIAIPPTATPETTMLLCASRPQPPPQPPYPLPPVHRPPTHELRPEAAAVLAAESSLSASAPRTASRTTSSQSTTSSQRRRGRSSTLPPSEKVASASDPASDKGEAEPLGRRASGGSSAARRARSR